MPTLYVSDLDGTLLNPQAKLSGKTISILNALIEQRVYFSYATARSFSSASLVTAGLRLSLPVITYNGTFFVRPQDGHILEALTFDALQVDYIRSVMERHGASPLVYSLQDGMERVSWVREQENTGVKSYLQSRAGDRRLNGLSDEAGLYQGSVFYVTLIGTKEELEPLVSQFRDCTQFVCLFQREIYKEDEYWLEIMPAGATKAQGMERLKRMIGCDRVVCFGDGLNDIPMFEAADEAYAVGNAHVRLKEMAAAVIGTNQNDGVAEWMEKSCKL